MPAPSLVIELVKRFDDHSAHYRSDEYKEDHLRQEFINPLFECLGWDMSNKAGYAPAYRDVIHEDAIKIGGQTKAPDYCFRIAGLRKFFLEAKKPAVGLKKNPDPAYQLRRYAWSAVLPVSILTNFAEFAVYDCRKKPVHLDKASAGRVTFYTHHELLSNWDEIAGIFSKDAILKGSFDKFAESTKGKRGTAAVDGAFLAEIENWRLELAKNLALRNPALEQRELNFAVQVTIDRILFLRMCEDRGIELYGQLQKQTEHDQIYKGLLELFRHADGKYNSGLFHFDREANRAEPDDLTPGLKIDDKVLKDIIGGLYFPECPYEFSVFPADILGQVYEQFLGKVIRLTAGHQAKVEDKPEVKKAGGVYYTPSYIVQYIVEQTVGKLLGEIAPGKLGTLWQQAAKLRIVDPACGSGSFLLGAYQHLLDWHRDSYIADGPEKHPNELVSAPGGDYRLSNAIKKSILLNNIYGVDIDPQAVEVTKLSLALKVLEGETNHTLFAKERALPDFDRNIRCGNSLIGPDFYDQPQASLFANDEEERLRINVFDWHAAFPKIMKDGGFDAVIGNPPWGQKAIEDDGVARDYIRTRFPSIGGIYDLFRPFVDCGVGLVAPRGSFAMVLPDIVLLKDYPETRKLLLERLTLSRLDWWGMAFPNAVIDAATIIGEKRLAPSTHRVHVHVRDEVSPIEHDIPQADFENNPRYVFNLHMTSSLREVVDRLRSFPTLSDFCEIHEGVHSGNIREELFVDDKLDASCRELYFGRGEVRPYQLKWAGQYVRLSASPKAKTKARYANVGRPEWYDAEKVLVRRTGDYVLAAVDRQQRYASNNFFLVIPYAPHELNLDGFAALLNSSFMTWYFRTIEPRRGRVFAEIKIKHLSTFPVPSRVGACRVLNQLGLERAELADELDRAKLGRAKDVLHRRIEYVDGSINRALCATFSVPAELVTPTPSLLEAS